MINIGFYRLNPNASIPLFGSEFAACFDLRYCCPLDMISGIKGYNLDNESVVREIDDKDGSFYILPGDRLLVPTGLIFKLQEPYFDSGNSITDCSIRLHPRSGLSLKRGLILANAEGVVDYDYQEEVFIILTNISTLAARIEDQERICQAEVVRTPPVTFSELSRKPEPYSARDGGFGSTGSL
jgi:dUTP pyrophosphatase